MAHDPDDYEMRERYRRRYMRPRTGQLKAVLGCVECAGEGGWEVLDGPDPVFGGMRTRWQPCPACRGDGWGDDGEDDAP